MHQLPTSITAYGRRHSLYGLPSSFVCLLGYVVEIFINPRSAPRSMPCLSPTLCMSLAGNRAPGYPKVQRQGYVPRRRLPRMPIKLPFQESPRYQRMGSATDQRTNRCAVSVRGTTSPQRDPCQAPSLSTASVSSDRSPETPPALSGYFHQAGLAPACPAPRDQEYRERPCIPTRKAQHDTSAHCRRDGQGDCRIADCGLVTEPSPSSSYTDPGEDSPCHLLRCPPSSFVTMAALLLDPTSQYAFSIPVTSFCRDVRSAPAFASYRVLQATHYKARDVLGHEFVLLHVTTGEYSLALRVERRPSGPNFSDTVLTDDRISREAHTPDETIFHERFYTVGDLLCPLASPAMPLSTICDIFQALEEQPVRYKLLSQQSYWYCSMFLHRLRNAAPGWWLVKMQGPFHVWKRRSKFLRRSVIMTSDDIERDIDAYFGREQGSANVSVNVNREEGYFDVNGTERRWETWRRSASSFGSPVTGRWSSSTAVDEFGSPQLSDADIAAKKKAQESLEELRTLCDPSMLHLIN